MLTEIKLKNFKCFGNEIIAPVDRLNLFTGFNGRGKSTLLQSLLCMRQSSEKSKTTDRLFFNGGCVELGSFEDVKNVSISRTEDIEFGFEFEKGEDYVTIRYHFKEDDQDDLTALIRRIDVEGEFRGSAFEWVVENKKRMAHIAERDIEETFYNLFIDHQRSDDPLNKFIGSELSLFNRVHYVSADRIGPRDFYLRESYSDFPNVGSRGQYAVDILSKNKTVAVDDLMRLASAESDLFPDQTSAWMEHIFAGGRLFIKPVDANMISMRLNADSSRNRFKPVNVGFGYSYVLPIIVAGLMAKKGEMLIVENPEAHLTPLAQNRIAGFLAGVSAKGVQVFIESHSEHILNGLRIACKQDASIQGSTNILFFEGEKEYVIKKIPVDEKGRIDNWPDGFFDQSEKEFGQIHKI